MNPPPSTPPVGSISSVALVGVLLAWALEPEGFVTFSTGLATLYVWAVRPLKERLPTRLARAPGEARAPRPGASPEAGVEEGDEGPVPAVLAGGPVRARLEAMDAFCRQRGPEALPALGRLLSDPEPEIAEAAANWLGEIGGEDALRLLLEADGRPPSTGLDRPGDPAGGRPRGGRPPAPPPAPDPVTSPALRLFEPLARQGFRALHRYTPHDPLELDERRLVEALLALSCSLAEKPALRYFAVKNLARFQHPDISETLLDLLRDPLPLVRYAAAECLGTHGDAEAVAPLVEALEDPESSVRASAAHTLAALGGDIAIRPLLQLRDDPDQVVRYAARRALDAIGKRKKIGTLLRRA